MKAVAIFADGDLVQVIKTGLATFGTVGRVVSNRIAGGNVFVTVVDDDGCRFSYNQKSLTAFHKQAAQAKSGPAKLPHVIAYSDSSFWNNSAVDAEAVRNNVERESMEFDLRMAHSREEFLEDSESIIIDLLDSWEHVFVIFPDGSVERMIKPKTSFTTKLLD